MTSKYVLAISGNDIFSGGGLYADLATYVANGLHGFVAVTCLTAMTDKGFEVFATDNKVFQHQLNSLQEVPFSAIKLGLLPNIEIAEMAGKFLKERQNLPVVLDPVLVCKESHDSAVSALRTELLKLFPFASVVTPNLVEAELLTQGSIKTLADLKAAARQLYEWGAKAVVVKGGNRFDQERAVDVFYDGKTFEVLESPILTNNNVGAGCTFASSITSQLVQGKSAFEAVRLSKNFVYQAIRHSDSYGVKQQYD